MRRRQEEPYEPYQRRGALPIQSSITRKSLKINTSTKQILGNLYFGFGKT